MSVDVEVLTIAGCPNADAAVHLVEEVARDLGAGIALGIVEIADATTARARRFLGSPTVRVRGDDVEEGADGRHDFVVACRIYPTAAGPTGVPPRAWVEVALSRAIHES